MEVQTSHFGLLDVPESELIRFPKGLPGFEECTLFIMVSPEEDEPFSFLQSAQRMELVFVVADPFLFYAEYDFELPHAALAELNISSPEQVLIRGIISMGDDPAKTSINLVAPIVVNTDARIGKQVVLAATQYKTRHPIFSNSSSGSVLKGG
ncbi:flagellar assembly protein FliW [Paenibacillus sp. IB182496]|uniref:Flagellar assembly factor FliW n=1 Tax=Paenibacillus sabuli TaxID=2772509 RepID=A0A927BS86_9BACL|nr:flagellar assembly protein FliW [Paenibacillus sabuli]MBD2845832.1 flagellar assembly protein FliW [Paenibacillus sabuli]